MRRDLSFTERLAFSGLMSLALSFVVAASPIWSKIPDITGLFPGTYATLFRAMPGAPNTAIAFALFFVATFLFLLLAQHPVIGISAIVASVLLFAGYPYSQIRWHEVIPFLRFKTRDPGLAEWVIGLLPMLLLVLIPILLQVRGILARYEEKGLDKDALRPAKRHLIELAVFHGAVAVAFTVVMGIVLLGLLPDLSTDSGWLVDNSLLVLFAAGILLLVGIGIGSGIFTRGEPVADGRTEEKGQVETGKGT